MILIERLADNAIMNDRQLGGWGKATKYAELIAQRDALPGNTHADVLARMNAAIAILASDKALWESRRIQSVCAMFGGVPSDYRVREVPEGEEWQALTARYIYIEDDKLYYNVAKEYTVSGDIIVVNTGWVSGNHRLMSPDMTDFSSLTLTEPLNFALVYAVSTATQEISVQLLTRADDEEFGALPANMKKLRVICEGVVNLDHTITLHEVP